jgi:hypothetical protein
LSRRLQNVLIVLVSSAISLVLLEIGLRVTGFSAPSFYQPDPHTGARHRPFAEGWDRREGETFVRISSQGLRDVEHEEEKPPGTFRMVILGDSYAEGLAVAIEETFWWIAAKELEKCPALGGAKVEPINLGVSGYGTGQALLALRDRGWTFDPDLVVLAFFTENDVRDNSRALSKEPLRPYFRFDGDRLVLDDSFLDNAEYEAKQSWPSQILYGLIDRSRLLQLANLAENNLRKRFVLEQEGGGTGLEPPARAVRHPIYADPADDRWREAWKVTDALVGELSHEVTARSKSFVLMSLSNPIQVHPDRALRAKFEEAYGVPDLFHAERHLETIAAFPYLKIAPLMQAEADRSGTFFHGFERIGSKGAGHWNADGHRFAGRELARFVCSLR